MIFSTLKLGIQLPQIERPNRVDPREISTIREDPNSLLYNPRIDLITLAAPSDNTDAGSDVVHLIRSGFKNPTYAFMDVVWWI